MRLMFVVALAFAASACAQDPYAQRLRNPRLGAPGWVAASLLEQAATTPAERAQMVAFAEDSDVLFARGCAEPRQGVWRGAEGLAPSDRALAELANDDGVVVRHRIQVTACGENRLHALYAAPGGGPIEQGVPGGSIASLALQREVLDVVGPQAAGIISASLPEGACDPMADAPWIRDTALLASPDDGRWRERWIFAACGRTREVEISFREIDGDATFRAPIFLE